MSKVTSKRQVTIPKEVGDRYRIEPGDEIRWIPAGTEIRVVPPRGSGPVRLSVEERLSLFDRASARRDALMGGSAARESDRSEERGWTRSELYERGRAR